jgi:hypothetical protein
MSDMTFSRSHAGIEHFPLKWTSATAENATKQENLEHGPIQLKRDMLSRRGASLKSRAAEQD